MLSLNLALCALYVSQATCTFENKQQLHEEKDEPEENVQKVDERDLQKYFDRFTEAVISLNDTVEKIKNSKATLFSLIHLKKQIVNKTEINQITHDIATLNTKIGLLEEQNTCYVLLAAINYLHWLQVKDHIKINK